MVLVMYVAVDNVKYMNVAATLTVLLIQMAMFAMQVHRHVLAPQKVIVQQVNFVLVVAVLHAP